MRPPPQEVQPTQPLDRRFIAGLAPSMIALLQKSIQFESTSGDEAPFVRFLENFARQSGFQTDLWVADESLLASYPQSHARHLPLANRPTLVITLPGRGAGPNLFFNAHSDVVAAPDPQHWHSPPFSGAIAANRVYGRGACDTKGPLISALWAMLAIRDSGVTLPGDVHLEIVPGEEDCVGLGTLTSLVRGYRAAAAVILEPTESMPRCASRGGCRFEIIATGRAVHGTVKWLGDDAIQRMRRIESALADLEERYNDRAADPLFADYPIARPITVDKISGGTWQGMVADRCECGGYLELLPADDAAQWQDAFRTDLLARLDPADADHVQVTFIEDYAGHSTAPDSALCHAAQASVPAELWKGWKAFNSGCEAGLRAAYHKTPTLVWGPGSLAQAHGVDEYVEIDEVENVAAMFVELARRCCGRIIE